MKIFLNLNPSRGWFWWSLGESIDRPLVNGCVFHSEAECLASAKSAVHALALEVVT